MNHLEAAQQLVTDIETEFPETADDEIGKLVTALANLRALRSQILAQRKVEFFATKEKEFKAFVATRNAEVATEQAFAVEILRGAVKE